MLELGILRYVDVSAKIFPILYTPLENLTTRIVIITILKKNLLSYACFLNFSMLQIKCLLCCIRWINFRSCIRKTIAKKQKSRQINVVKCRKLMQQHASKFWQLEKLKTPFTCCTVVQNTISITLFKNLAKNIDRAHFLLWLT